MPRDPGKHVQFIIKPANERKFDTNISTKISKYIICKHATHCIDVNILASY